MPSSTFNTVGWVAMEGLDSFQANLGVIKKMSSEYENEFKKEFAPGSTVTVPMPQRFIAQTNNWQFTPEGMYRPTTTITVDTSKHVMFQLTATEQALHTERGQARFKKIYLDPAMLQLSTALERAAIAYMTPRINNVVGALGTTPTTLAPYAAAKTRLEENDQFADPTLFWSPTMAENIGTALLTSYNSKYSGEAVKDSRISGSIAGMKTVVSNLLSSHTCGVWQTPANVTVSGAGQSGSSLLVNCDNGDTFKAGDVFTIASVNNVEAQSRQSTGSPKHFVVQSDVTATATTATLSIYPSIVGPNNQQQNVDALPANAALLTLMPGTTAPSTGPKSGKIGLVLTDQAFLVASVPIIKGSTPGVETKSVTDPNSGMTMNVANWFDPQTMRWCWRFDVLFGFGVAYADQGAVKIASSK